MKTKYTLVETFADESWDKFIERSPNGTIFSNSRYLNAAEVKYKLYYCYKKEEVKAAVALIENEIGDSVILDDLVIYNGIMYSKLSIVKNQAQQCSEQLKIQEFIVNELISLYKNIQISLHPSIVDIRAALWVHYGTGLPKYIPNIRYTSYIDISDFRKSKKLEDISIYNKASASRRQQIRYAIKRGYETKVIFDVSLFIKFYKKTMGRQRLEVENIKLKRMEKLASILLQNNMAKIYASYNEFNEIESMSLFGWDNKRAYYIFGANNPDKRSGHGGTNVLWEAFFDLSEMGVDEVDLEGVNSPHRGWFKLSYGGNILPHYEIHYRS